MIDDEAQKIVHLMLAHLLPKHHLEEVVEVGAMTFQIIVIFVEIDTIVAWAYRVSFQEAKH